MGLVLVASHKEEELLLKLVTEFASKVIMPRRYQPSETFKKYMAAGIYGITDVTVDHETNEAVFEISIPDHYIQFFNYMVGNLRKQCLAPDTNLQD